jgi:nucleoid-associated protein YgaU
LTNRALVGNRSPLPAVVENAAAATAVTTCEEIAMSVLDFVKSAGERIVTNAKAAASFHPGRDSEPSEKKSPAPQAAPANVDEAGPAIANYIRAQGLQVEDLKVRFDAKSSTVYVAGTAKDQETKEKVILCCGNVDGVEHVSEQLSVKESSPASRYHTVKSGETLSAIAKQYYSDANKYPLIFEANKPMLKHPDKIYPGQSLRIPELH